MSARPGWFSVRAREQVDDAARHEQFDEVLWKRS